GLDEQPVVNPPPRGVHGLGEVGPELRVRHAAALAEAVGDLRQSRGEHPERLAPRGEIPARGAGETLRVLRGQGEAAGGRVVVDHAAGGHRAEPLAHVPLVEAGARGQLRTRRRALRGRLEEPVTVAELDHQREHAAGVEPEHLAGKLLDAPLIELRPPDPSEAPARSLALSLSTLNTHAMVRAIRSRALLRRSFRLM